MSRLTTSTLQANDGANGDYSSSGYAVPGIGIGIYVGVGGDVMIHTRKGTDLLFTGVPQGTFMQVPMFDAIVASGTTASDLTVSYITFPGA